MKKLIYATYLIISIVLPCTLSATDSSSSAQTQNTVTTYVFGRVKEVSNDKKTVTINKGNGDHAKPGMPVTFRFNRGESGKSGAAVEWDIVLAKGTISSADEYSSIVKLTLVNDEVQVGDYLGEDDIVRLADNYGRA